MLCSFEKNGCPTLVETCLESQTQQFFPWVSELGSDMCESQTQLPVHWVFVWCTYVVVIKGRAQQILAEFVKETKLSLHWVPLLYTYRRRSQTQQPLLSHCSSGSANPCWVGGRRLKYSIAVLVERGLNHLVLSCVSLTRCSTFDESIRLAACWTLSGAIRQQCGGESVVLFLSQEVVQIL